MALITRLSRQSMQTLQIVCSLTEYIVHVHRIKIEWGHLWAAD